MTLTIELRDVERHTAKSYIGNLYATLDRRHPPGNMWDIVAKTGDGDVFCKTKITAPDGKPWIVAATALMEAANRMEAVTAPRR